MAHRLRLQLLAHLNEYVIGQERAKKVLAVACVPRLPPLERATPTCRLGSRLPGLTSRRVYNHYARLQQLLEQDERANAKPTRTTSLGLPIPFQAAGWTPIEPDALTPDERKRIDSHLAQTPSFLPGVQSADIKPKPRHRKGPSREEAKENAAAVAGEDASSEGGSKEPSTPVPTNDATTTTRYFRTPSGELAFFQIQTQPFDGDGDEGSPSKDPTLYNRVPEVYVVDEKALSSTSPPSASSSSASDRPPVNDASPSPSDILTDFLGQVGGTPRLPRPSPIAHAQPPLFEKSNVLLLGPTGVGKSLLARTLARALDVPFVSVEATSMTSAGYVGEDVENCVARLVEAADGDVERAGRGCVGPLPVPASGGASEFDAMD